MTMENKQTASDRVSSVSIMDVATAKARGKSFQENKWGHRHGQAWDDSLRFGHLTGHRSNTGSALARMIDGWARYADAHRERYEAGIMDCGVMGPAWEQIGKGLRTMLNGELGNLDAGTLDEIIGGILRNEGAEFDA
jgi:hypothetical protein